MFKLIFLKAKASFILTFSVCIEKIEKYYCKMLPVQIFNHLVVENEERLEQLRFRNIERRILRSDSDPFSTTDEQFIGHFRLTKEMVSHIILPAIVPHIPVASTLALEPVQKVLITLAFFASGEYQRCLGENFNFPSSQPTVSKVVSQVTPLIIQNLSEGWIVFPINREQRNQLKQRFMENTGFPGVIGAVDCTHVPILAPQVQEHNYLNRKGYHSKNVQIVYDSDCNILNVNARWGGAAHDSFIFRNSAVSAKMERNWLAGDENTWLLGDSGYPQKPYVMTPILNALPGSPEFRYTYCHVRARVCIERCNGILKSRFRCCSHDRKLRYNPQLVGEIISACAILHNICMRGRLDINEDNPIRHDNPVLDEAEPPVNLRNDDIGLIARRRLIARYFT